MIPIFNQAQIKKEVFCPLCKNTAIFEDENAIEPILNCPTPGCKANIENDEIIIKANLYAERFFPDKNLRPEYDGDDKKLWLTVKKTSMLLSISEYSIRKWCKEKKELECKQKNDNSGPHLPYFIDASTVVFFYKINEKYLQGITIKEAAKIYKLSEYQIRKKIREKKIDAKKITRSFLINKNDLTKLG